MCMLRQSSQRQFAAVVTTVAAFTNLRSPSQFSVYHFVISMSVMSTALYGFQYNSVLFTLTLCCLLHCYNICLFSTHLYEYSFVEYTD